MENLAGNTTLIMGALLAVSEVLALTKLRSNSVFQLIFNVLRTLNFTGLRTKKREEG